MACLSPYCCHARERAGQEVALLEMGIFVRGMPKVDRGSWFEDNGRYESR